MTLQQINTQYYEECNRTLSGIENWKKSGLTVTADRVNKTFKADRRLRRKNIFDMVTLDWFAWSVYNLYHAVSNIPKRIWETRGKKITPDWI